MSKRNIHGKTGKIINGRQRYGDMLVDYYNGRKRKEERASNPLPRVNGIRLIVLEAYEEGGKTAAYKAIKMANEKIGKPAYSEENADKWIEEYEQTR